MKNIDEMLDKLGSLADEGLTLRQTIILEQCINFMERNKHHFENRERWKEIDAMASNSGKSWSDEDNLTLFRLVNEGLPIEIIAEHLKRTVASCKAHFKRIATHYRLEAQIKEAVTPKLSYIEKEYEIVKSMGYKLLLDNEGKPWNERDDENLLELYPICSLYSLNGMFRRSFEEIVGRYTMLSSKEKFADHIPSKEETGFVS